MKVTKPDLYSKASDSLLEESLAEHKPTVIAQITDSHLFSSLNGLHHGYNVLKNLKDVLFSIRHRCEIEAIIFTGDLTQDNTEQSYQNFVDCVSECKITVPIYYLAGNHDEPALLDKYFSASPFIADKEITFTHWQIQLVNSKSETPAGYVSKEALNKLEGAISKDKCQLLMMHHHPIDVGYFIDKHGLQNKSDFWQAINCYTNIKGIACGHVHGAMELTQPLNQQFKSQSIKSKEPVILYTCPATSMQFDPDAKEGGALDKGPGYRVFTLYPEGKLLTNIVML